MLNTILQDFVKQIEEKFGDFAKELREKFDFPEIEKALGNIANQLVASVLEKMLNDLLADSDFLRELRELGGRFALKYQEYRQVNIRLWNGEIIKVQAPYFLKASPKRGRKKKGPNGRGCYLGLEVVGIISRCSANFVSEVVQTAVLCPSFEVAYKVLSRRGIKVDVKTIRRLCRKLGEIGLWNRGEISLDGKQDLKGRTLVIGIDGGRLRERINKKGRKKKDQKRQGFYAEWKEPTLFTIYLLDEQGKIVKEFAPLHDATMGKYQTLFALLKQYLQALDLKSIERIVFCADGDETIWLGVEELLVNIGIDQTNVFQVLDYPHAKQNLQQIINLVSAKMKAKHNVDKTWRDLLWKGDIQGLYRAICQAIHGKKKREQALKKWENYFEKNAKRMQYARFKDACLPCGSGCVESAIRRVINLRLKAPGSFWTKEMAEYFLFLRSQLISGRWDIFMTNVSRLKRKWMDQQTDNVIQLPTKAEDQFSDAEKPKPEQKCLNVA